MQRRRIGSQETTVIHYRWPSQSRTAPRCSCSKGAYAAGVVVNGIGLLHEGDDGARDAAVFRFPGQYSEADLEREWSDQVANLDSLFDNKGMKGTTPTGPAILQAAERVTVTTL